MYKHNNILIYLYTYTQRYTYIFMYTLIYICKQSHVNTFR